MTESQIQELLQTQTNGSSAGSGDLLTTLLQPLMPMLTLLFVASIILTIVVVVFFIINIVQKQRQHAAIMRIDRNLQKLVDRQTPEQLPAPQPLSSTSNSGLEQTVD